MKRIWQYSSSLLLTALLAHQASAQGLGPRSWKSYLPGEKQVSAVEMEAAPVQELPSLEQEKKNAAEKKSAAAEPAKASKIPATADAGKAKSVGYYDLAEQPPPAPGLLNGSQPSPSDAGNPFVDEAKGVKPVAGLTPTCTNGVGCSDPTCGCNSGGAGGCDGGCDCGCNENPLPAAGCETAVARNFARIEYLMWWGRGRSTPELVTTSFNGTPQAQAGVLGQPNTTVLFGGEDIGTDWRSGLRLTVGRVLDQDGNWMAVGRFFGMDDSSEEFHATSAAGDPILARPFFNTLLAQEDAFLVAFPGLSVNGSVDIFSKTDTMGAEAYVRHLILGEEDMTVDVLAGYQFTRINDSLDIRNSSLVLLDPRGIFPPNTTIAMRDHFRTRNEFHGGVVGGVIDVYRGPWKIEFLGKVGIGNMHQTVDINGNTIITPQVGPVVNDPNGLLARQTNNGSYNRDVFTFIPEANFTVGYAINNWNFTVGYSFIYWNDVAFAGSQIDRSVNLSNPVVGDPRPTFDFRDTDFWLMGVNFGVEYSF